MISIREMTAADEGAVMEMVDRFYHSPAVEHEVAHLLHKADLRRVFARLLLVLLLDPE